MSAKSKYQTKNVKFGGKSVVLFSLDGLTWSSRKDELSGIQARHEQQKIALSQLKTENGEADKTAKDGQAGKSAVAAETPVTADPPAGEKPAPQKAIAPKPLPAKKAAPAPKLVTRSKPTSVVKQPKPEASPKKRVSAAPKAKVTRGKSKRAAA